MNEPLKGNEIIAQVIRENYDLGEVDLPQMLEAAHQRRHRKLAVETSQGKFLIKTYKRDPYVLDALRFQHKLSAHLHEGGLPIAQIQHAKNGKTIVEIDDWAIELQHFIVGGSMKVTPRSLAITAEALGRFHQICHDFPRPPRDAQMWRFSEVPRSSLSTLYEKAKESGDESTATDCCNRIAMFLHNAKTDLSEEARNTFETGLIHGDWHGGNLMFHDDELAAIIDLEFAGDGCYLEDLSYGISNLCIRTSTEPERLAVRTNIVLDNYSRYRSLSFAEEAALYFAIGIKHVATVSYQIEQGNDVAGLSAAQWMTRLDLQCQWLAERAHKVRWR